jgi:chemotaxis protein MotA
MVFIFGLVFALASVFGGYVLHHGPMGVFIDAWTEYIVIIGSGIGLFIAANGMDVVKRTIGAVIHLLKPDVFTKAEFLNLMAILYQLFVVARKDGILALEGHVENPETSTIFSKYPGFLHNHHAVHFLCDNVKIIMGGGIPPHDLDEMMEMDLETMGKEAHVVPEAVQNMADAMPALGIVACVLGVVITMGKIGGDPREIGASVGVALVGTFLGIGASYLMLAPLARALGLRHAPEEIYLNCIRHALHSFARGEAPMICVEFARRNVPPERRPGLVEAEKFCKESGKSGG